MKLYYHPISTTSRSVMLFAGEEGIQFEYALVDLANGEQYQPAFSAINPSHQVPVLEDGDFRLTESSAILKYLAAKTGSKAYPADLKQRARVDERLDWFNTGFYRDFCYGLIYPQIFSVMKRADEAVQAGTLEHGKNKTLGWLKVLDEHIIGPRNRFVCGDAITVADYLGSVMTLSNEAICCNMKPYPNITRWMNSMKALKSWAKTNEMFQQYMIDPAKEKSFAAV